MRILFFVILFLLAFGERVVIDFGPNVELVTATMLMASAYLGRRWALWLVFTVLVLSDTLIGNTSIFVFTWSGFLIPAIFSSGVFRGRKLQGLRRVFMGTGLGVASNLFFFLWTNFGVWLLDVWGMYTRDLNGILMSYVNGLPFLRMQIMSTISFVTLGFTIVEIVKVLSKRLVDSISFLAALVDE